MNTEDQITGLLAKAEPLRCLPDDEAELLGLPRLVDQINALRALQAVEPQHNELVVQQHKMALEAEGRGRELREFSEAVDAPKRRGRPPKAASEGADA